MNFTPYTPVFETCIRKALLGEVYTTPKPGLVDLLDNGSHKDMDFHTFEKSSTAIAPYLLKMARTGYDLADSDSIRLLFPAIRKIGQKAEQAMFAATEGVNTHKGAIFTLGILCAAAGACLKRETARPAYGICQNPKSALPAYGTCQKPDSALPAFMVLDLTKEMMSEHMEQELRQISEHAPKTHGELLYHQYGEEGIRGEAKEGFPIIRNVAYPVMLRCKTSFSEFSSDDPSAGNPQGISLYKKALSDNQIHLQVLLAIMAHLRDTNVIIRSSIEEAEWLRNQAGKLLSEGGVFPDNANLPDSSFSADDGIKKLLELNEQCKVKNISPGGAADILAATILLYELERAFSGARSGSDP